MATEVKLPRLGQGMESGTVVRWLKQEGERVEKGEPLYELDTEKVTQEVEAEASGVLLKIAVQEGEVPVGQTVAVIGEEGEDVPQAEEPERRGDRGRRDAARGRLARAGARRRARGGRRSFRCARVLRAGDRGPRAAAERTRQGLAARPPDRARARDRPRAAPGHRAGGTNRRRGRGARRDRAGRSPRGGAGAAPPGEVEVVPLTSIRKTIARRLTEAWQAPVFQISMSADMSRALTLRRQLVELAKDGPKPTISDVLTKIAASALMRHRRLNAEFAGEEVRIHPSANVGMAVATDRGLVVPVIRGAERLSIQEIAAARVELVDRARGGKLQQADLEGGTFTISNLGMFGVEQFVAVLNPPQVAILAVGAVEEKPVVREGEFVARPLMSLTLTCDHRAVDGADAADFLRTVRSMLEEPGLAL